jgi:hypothetical protein
MEQSRPGTSRTLPSHIQARYGLDRRRRGPLAVAIVLIVTLALALGWSWWSLSQPRATGSMLRWEVVSVERVDLTFEVRREPGQPTFCVLRAQDVDHIDVAYTVIEIPAGDAYHQQDYRLRTLTRAHIAELLACADGVPPVRVLPPQFPPGVAPPPQPWTP